MVRVVLRFKKTAFLRFLSAIETVPTGVADLALYVRVLLKERVSNISKAISDASVKNLHLAGVWWTDTDPNACVDRYAFRAFLKACDVQRMSLQEDESFTREKKGQQMEFTANGVQDTRFFQRCGNQFSKQYCDDKIFSGAQSYGKTWVSSWQIDARGKKSHFSSKNRCSLR